MVKSKALLHLPTEMVTMRPLIDAALTASYLSFKGAVGIADLVGAVQGALVSLPGAIKGMSLARAASTKQGHIAHCSVVLYCTS